MKKISKKNKGFSLVEVIVAMFIFTTIMMSTAAFFGKSMFSYRSAKAIQKDLENAQFAMNLMAKSLRTSTVFSNGLLITYVKIFDYSQNKCIGYKLDSGVLQVATFNTGYDVEPVNAETNKTDCQTRTLSGFSPMTTGTVTGFFNIIPSAPNTVGKVTISMKVCPENGCSGNPKDEAKIQSTVSLRDYKEAGL